jgi:uncharacterized protein YegP (UPF0339 family)
MAQQFYIDDKGEHRWRVIAKNGSDVVGDSGEGYVREIDAARGLLSLIDAVDVEELRSHVSGLEEKGSMSN